MASRPPLDLLIVGAGPIGLATAAAALRCGAQRVLVVDQARALRPVGRNIDLLPNAYRVLCHLVPGIAERLQPFLNVPKPGKSRFSTMSADGSFIAAAKVQDYGKTASLYWWQIQQIILDLIPHDDILVLNHQLVNISHDDIEHVATAEFIADRQRENRYKNWEGDDSDAPCDGDNFTSLDASRYFETVNSGSENELSDYRSEVRHVKCRAKIIVGADGINSVARRCIYRESCSEWEHFANAIYSGFTSIIAVGNPQFSSEEEETVSGLYLRESPFVRVTTSEEKVAFDSPRVMLVHPPEASKARFRWMVSYSLAIDENIFRSASQQELEEIACCKAREYGFSESLLTLSSKLWKSKSETTRSNRAYYIVPAAHPPPYEKICSQPEREYPRGFRRPWYHGRVVLAGDSAHACPPFLGQGTAMGFEDVFELMKKLSDAAVWSQENKIVRKETLKVAFEQYYTSRIDRVSFLQREVMNRVSEYDLEETAELRDTLWAYDPTENKAGR